MLTVYIFCGRFQVNRDQQSDQELLDQVKQRRVEHETRKEQLEEQR